jgi:tRNA pseudouridine13 synthase
MPSASIKTYPEDWQVREVLEIPFSGSGEHAYFHVEKTGWNTADVQRALARHFQLQLHDVGLSGLKDKHALTSQWFSVPTPKEEWPLELSGLRCLQVARHATKLRRGSHVRNDFVITLRQVTGMTGHELTSLADGAANYFGPQRVSESNVEQAKQWLFTRREQRHGNKSRQGWHLSVLRSHLFNKVLRAREIAGQHEQILDGDVVIDGVPTGPLWGRGRSATQGLAAEIEASALRDEAELCHELEFAGVQQARRAFSIRPINLHIAYEAAAQTVTLSFGLPAGAYATTLLGSAMLLTDAHDA